MDSSAVANKPLGVVPRPNHFEMNINDKSYDHQHILDASVSPSHITFGSRTLIPRYIGPVVLAKNGFKLRYNVNAFYYIAVYLFGCMSAAYFYGFTNGPEQWVNILREANGTDVNINNQVSSCAGSAPQPHGHKRQSSTSGGGEPKKQRSNDRDQNENPYNGNSNNNADDDHNDNGGSGGNNNIKKPNKDETPKKNLACPFQKLYPGRFSDCEQHKLTNWDRVLQHLKRRHVLEDPYCAVCRKSFPAGREDLRDEHSRQRTCQVAGVKETGLLLPTEYDGLKNLGRGSDEGKYKAAWGRLFPGEPCPKSFVLETQLEMLKRKLEMRERELETLKRKLEMLERDAPVVLSGVPDFVWMSDARKTELVRALFRRGSAPESGPPPTQTPNPDQAPSSISQLNVGTIPADGQRMAHDPVLDFSGPAIDPQLMTAEASYYSFSAPTSPEQNLPTPPVMNTDPTASTPIISTQVEHGHLPHGFGSNPQEESNLTTGRAIDTTALPELPGQVLMDSAPGFYPQNFQGQQHLFGQLSSMYPDSWWNLMNGNFPPNAGADSSPDFGVNEDGDGPSSGSGYHGPGSGQMR